MSQIKILSAALAELDTIDHVISAERFERINSDNGLNFSVPLDATTNDLITTTNVVGYGTDYFDIARYTKGQNGSGLPVAQVECEHISYRLNDPAFNKEWFTEIGTPTQILTKLLDGTGFTVGTVDFTTAMTYSAQQAMSRRGLLMELIALLGGEGYFNGFTISILAQRGSTTPKDLTAYSNITVLSKSVDKRSLDALGNPTIAYQCAITNPVELALGDVVTLGYNLLDIDVTLRIVSISANPYDTSEIDIEVGNYTNALEDDMYRIETSMVAKGNTYYGARISPENGFESIRNDKMARTVMNADQFAMQTGDGSGSSWTNKLYFDPATDKYVFDGTLSATMIEALEAEFDVTISQTVIVNQLSAQKGNIAELTVDQIDTSDFVQRYLDEDTSPVGYWKGYDQFIEFYEAAVPEGDIYYTQVKNRQGQDIYWLDETHTGTTIEITDYPVYRYAYNGDDLAGVVKLKIFHEIDPVTGFATPKMIWGQGSGVDDRMQAIIMKDTDGLLLKYTTSTGEVVALRLGEDGFDGVNFAVHGAPPEINNISVYSNGMILVDEFTTTVDYTFVRDSKGRITSITNNNSTHVTNVTWNTTAKP